MFSDIVQKTLDECIVEIKKENNMDKIKSEFLNPIIEHILYQIYPYGILFIICMSITFIFITIIIIISVKNYL